MILPEGINLSGMFLMDLPFLKSFRQNNILGQKFKFHSVPNKRLDT